MTASLIKLEQAERLLAEASTLEDLRSIRDIAVAAQSYARAAHLGLESQNRAAEVRLLAERQAGQMLVEMKEKGVRDQGNGGDRKSRSQNATVKLGDMGVSKQESAKWQALAALPEPKFQAAIQDGKKERLTDATVLNAVKEHKQTQKRAARQKELAAKAEAFTLAPALPTHGVTIHNADARAMSTLVEPRSVHLVVTSPPYNVGMDYRSHNDSMDVLAYQEMLSAVFQQCHTALVEGGRIAVVVPFGVGRNPYVLLAPMISDLLCGNGFALRGWIVWHKLSAMGSTSWGSYRLPTNPSLRDATECIIVAHKGEGVLHVPKDVLRTDDKGTYSPFLENAEDFTDMARDYWMIRPESATRVGHPAPFPLELAARLIRFFAYPGAHILDPFAGSGTVGKAAKDLGCEATLFDIDAGYCELARERVLEEDE